MKIVSIVGARPQFIKLAPFCRAVEAVNQSHPGAFEHHIVHTGQHYDEDMSGIFFTEMNIPEPDVDLGVGSASHGKQTGALLAGLEEIFISEQPDVVVIFGDTNSTLAGALAAAKLHIPIAHVEAGLRSRDKAMPEEINRIVSDHVASLNLAPTQQAMDNLALENLAGTSLLTGDIMLDAVRQHSEIAAKRACYERYGLEPQGYVVGTIHRAENTTLDVLPNLIEGLVAIAEMGFKLVVPLHPRTAKMVRDLPQTVRHDNLQLVEPVGYLDMINLLANAQLAITDSGGLQREAYFLNVPCITIRETTEWPETIEGNANVLVGSDKTKLVSAAKAWRERIADGPADFSASVAKQFGDGQAGKIILDELLKHFKP